MGYLIAHPLKWCWTRSNIIPRVLYLASPKELPMGVGRWKTLGTSYDHWCGQKVSSQVWCLSCLWRGSQPYTSRRGAVANWRKRAKTRTTTKSKPRKAIKQIRQAKKLEIAAVFQLDAPSRSSNSNPTEHITLCWPPSPTSWEQIIASNTLMNSLTNSSRLVRYHLIHS